MKQRFLVCLVGCFCLLLPIVAMAQGQPGGPNAPGTMMEKARKILDDLGLSPDQKTRIDAVLDQAKQDAQALVPQLRDMDPQDRQQKLRDFFGGVKDKIETELTADQKDQFEKKLADVRTKAGGLMVTGRIDRFRKALAELDLTDDQKTRTHSLLDDVAKKLEGLKDEKPEERQQKVQDVMDDVRQQLQQILTPDQLQSLREKMQQNNTQNGPGNNPAADKTAPLPATTQPKAVVPPPAPQTMMMDPMPQEKPNNAVSARPAATAQPAPDVGEPAPDFKLTRLDGSPVQLSSLKGRVIALIFGSYTCPIFRDRAASIDQFATSLGTRATVFLVYTREANPAGKSELDRNRDAHIAIVQPTDEAGRKAIARQAKESLHLTLPILVDDMDNTVTTAYGGFPNGAVLINRDGTIAGRQKWADPTVLKRLMDEALAKEYHANQ